jgi:hypothetical protein
VTGGGDADKPRSGCPFAGAKGSADGAFEGPAAAAATLGAAPAATADRRTNLRREIGFIKQSLAVRRSEVTGWHIAKKDESRADHARAPENRTPARGDRFLRNAARNRSLAIDNEHAKLLPSFHYVEGGIPALFASIPVIHLVFGLVIVFAPQVVGQPLPRQRCQASVLCSCRRVSLFHSNWR